MVMLLASVILVGAGFGVGEKFKDPEVVVVCMLIVWTQTLASLSDTQCAVCYGATVRAVFSIRDKLTGWSQLGPGLFWPICG